MTWKFYESFFATFNSTYYHASSHTNYLRAEQSSLLNHVLLPSVHSPTHAAKPMWALAHTPSQAQLRMGVPPVTIAKRTKGAGTSQITIRTSQFNCLTDCSIFIWSVLNPFTIILSHKITTIVSSLALEYIRNLSLRLPREWTENYCIFWSFHII